MVFSIRTCVARETQPMQPSSIFSSMRYLPASPWPTRRSSPSLFFNTAPSVGHRLFVSAYCLPHLGQLFMNELKPRLRRTFPGKLERITPLSRPATSLRPRTFFATQTSTFVDLCDEDNAPCGPRSPKSKVYDS